MRAESTAVAISVSQHLERHVVRKFADMRAVAAGSYNVDMLEVPLKLEADFLTPSLGTPLTSRPI